MPPLKPLIRDIELQPKQEELSDLVENGLATWIGVGGGRGAAKSTAIDRIMLERRIGHPGTIGAIVMRNYDQVKKYHIDPMLRDFPELNDLYHITESKIVIPMPDGPPSEIHFKHAESLVDIERLFRSGNYYDLFVDQAEQYTKEELVELKKVVRWKAVDVGVCKFALAFNMGGTGIDFLEKIFNSHEYSENQDPEDYTFIQFNPWDNVEWSRAQLIKDGKTPYWYYNVLTDAEREQYAAAGPAGKLYKAQDPALANRDWYGSWKALEGAFFGRVFDEESAVIRPDQVAALVKPWSKRWMSEDWGHGHFCVTQKHVMVDSSPAEVLEVLGWQVSKPLKIVITYSEYIAGGAGDSDEGGERAISPTDIGNEIVKRTPEEERPAHRAFFLSPDAFELSVRRAGQNQIAQELGKALKAGGLPYPTRADNSRAGGWSLMYSMLLETKRHGITGEKCWLISANCPELRRALPLLMRNPKDLDDVLKTDTKAADIKMDVADTARYGLKSMLSPGKKPKAEIVQDAIREAMYHGSPPIARAISTGDTMSRYSAPGPAVAEHIADQPTPNYTAAHMAHISTAAKMKKSSGPIVVRRSSWRRRGM